MSAQVYPALMQPKVNMVNTGLVLYWFLWTPVLPQPPLNINAYTQLWSPNLFQLEINSLCESIAFLLHHILCYESKLWAWESVACFHVILILHEEKTLG